MPVREARELVARRLGTDRVMAEPDAVDEIIAGCARLPLALAIAAARAMVNHRFPLRSLADELRDERNRLDVLDAGDHATNMRAVFSWSSQHLGTSAARMFRLMGLHPGPDISPAAAASLAGLPVDQIRGTLTELVRAHLINEHVPGRYTAHDLLRSYATEMSHVHDTDTERRAAVHRMLDHYLHTAHTAAELLSSRVDRISLVQPRPGAAAERLATCADALDWFDAERAVLLAADHEQALVHCQQAVMLLQELGDRSQEAFTWHSLGYARHQLGQHRRAIDDLRRALDLFRELGDRHYEAVTLTDLGDAHHARGETAATRDAWQHALHILTELHHADADKVRARLSRGVPDQDRLGAR